ncbi:Tyrosine-protein phosphatase non-receptor type 9 [Hypsibius exemplaris]|uniref:Tyrosine-protein phosphatase non-receptor type 9 n=1 Tax=Hypsibius exemplaris TaxID=2072580 RepID=A0A1W0WDE9_HYPEX|nr:Tyrosine-protein phosphatase non-receptor type 9 [Hypsibius exemplaris]
MEESTPENDQAVEEFMALANQWRLHPDAPTDEAVIKLDTALRFLMARKFHVQRAFELYQQHQIVRQKQDLRNIDPSAEPVKAELESGKFTVLSSRGFNGAAIALITGRLHFAKHHSATMKAILFQLDAALNDQNTQRQGLMLLYDMTGMGWINSDRALARDLLAILKGAFPARLKKILVVNPPSWLDIPFKFLKPFLSAKMVDRLFVISSTHLREHIPVESIPESLGGDYLHSHDEWLKRCLNLNTLDSDYSPKAPLVPRRLPNGGAAPSVRGDGWRDGQVFNNDIVQRLDEFADLKSSMSIHQRSDKGMGVAEFIALLHYKGRAGILQEYDTLRSAARALPDRNFTIFKATENRVKNRYVDVPCFDSSRVKLRDRPANDDYIHANFVDGYEQKNAFISTQGPMPKTFADFWMMVWQEDVRVLVMTTRTVERGKTKCGQYWPVEVKETVMMGDYEVTCYAGESLAHHVETQLIVKWKGESRQIVHLQFTDWPDYGVPHSAESMFDFIQLMRDNQSAAVRRMNPPWTGHPKGPPIIVHCSAGIGRSGTLCALDICLRRLDDCGLVDVHQSVEKLRSQRCQSIQMPEQYLFCNLAVVEYCVAKELIAIEDSALGEMLVWLHDQDD